MLQHARRSVGVVAVLATLAAGAFATSASAAKTTAVKITADGTFHGTTLGGTFKGTPFGSGKVTGTLLIPIATVTFHGTGGTATMRYKGILDGSSLTGAFKFIRGTGKFKHIKGSGRVVGNLSSGKYTYTGKAMY